MKKTVTRSDDGIDHKAIAAQAIKEREERYPVLDTNLDEAYNFQLRRVQELTEIARSALQK